MRSAVAVGESTCGTISIRAKLSRAAGCSTAARTIIQRSDERRRGGGIWTDFRPGDGLTLPGPGRLAIEGTDTACGPVQGFCREAPRTDGQSSTPVSLARFAMYEFVHDRGISLFIRVLG